MRFRLATAVLGVAATVLFAGTQPVLAAERQSDTAVRTAIRHAVTGKATAADLEIIKSDPQLARSVPVAAKKGRPVVTEVAPPTGSKAVQSRVSAATGVSALASYQQICRSVDYPLTLTSYVGTTIYTWHHQFAWCTANQVPDAEWSRVITYAPYNRLDYFTDKSSVVYPQALITDAVYAPVGSAVTSFYDGWGSPYYSYMARSVNLCLASQLGCYASNLPQSKLTIGRDNVYPAIASAG
ncbi:hypothetical protein [Streptomyces sp. NPDC001348]